MVLFVRKHIKFLLMLFSLTYNFGKQMKVLEFKPDDYYLKTIEKGPMTPLNDLFDTTKETSVCLRLMTRYRRSFIVVSNHIAKIIYYSLRRGPTGPSSLAPATQDKMHSFIIIQ